MFNFDGSNVGQLDNFIKFKNYKNSKLYSIEILPPDSKETTILCVKKYKNAFVFIINEVRKIFNVSYVKYNLGVIDNELYLIYQNNVSLEEYTKFNNFKGKIRHVYLQRAFAFNWLMSLNNNYENKIVVIPRQYCDNNMVDIINSESVTFVTVNEKSFNRDESKYSISKNIIENWFDGSYEVFDDVVRKLVNPIDVNLLRIELLKIVHKYDDSYIYWVNIVFKNILQYK